MPTIQSVLKQLFEAYPNTKNVTEGTVAMYVRQLAQFEPDELQAVVDQCVSDYKFLPSIAELKEAYRNMSGDLSKPTAIEAWEEVLFHFRRTGYTGTPQFENPITARVISGMGWQQLCISQDQMADRAHFIRSYNAIAERDEKIERLTPMARQLAEKNGGLQPVRNFLPLHMKWDTEDENC